MHRTALRLLVCLPLVCLVNPTAMAAPGPSLCVWDPVGAAGQMFSATKAYAAAMKKQGVNLTLKPYTDERVAAEDFKAGQCDALLATSIRTRPYNPVTAAIDSTGATTIVRNGKIDINASYEVVRKAMQVYASPAAAKLVVQDKYEVAGIIPMGALYAVVRDREIFKKGFAGVRLPAFENDKVQAYIFERVGAQAVPSDISNFVSKFNNGSVDAIFAPATSYVPLEIFRGVGTKGGVSRFPLRS